MRMVADSTYILDQTTRYDTKVDEVMNMVDNVVASGDEKIVIFSQWERMTRLVAAELKKRDIGFAYLHGGVPSPQRKHMVDNFSDDPSCRVFLSTDAGSTGLNLQVASIIINLDLPWNPAVLEQRIGRIYRIGQERNIQVYNLVAIDTIEQQMIGKLKFKSTMFEGVLDGGTDSVMRDDNAFKQIMTSLQEVMEEGENEAERDNASHPINTADREPEASTQEREHATDHLLDADEDTEPSATSPETSSDAPTSDGTSTDTTADVINAADNPEHLVQQGLSFLGGLLDTLKSPEKTARLVNTIVKRDETTGRTSINIPVPDSDSVHSLLNAIGKLLS